MNKLLTIALLFLSLNAFAQERIALVIGNADYKINPLANTLNDAQDMAKALEDLDFKVTLLQNANRKTMRDAIYDFSDKLNEDTVGLFYYAGHAIQYHGENYLIPINSLPEIKKIRHLEDEAVRSGMVLREMAVRQSQLNFVFLDACRNNPLPAESRGIEQGLARSQDAKGALIAYSTSPGNTAADGTGRNSPYTTHLLKQIYTPNRPIQLMLTDVAKSVINETNGHQEPWYESSITGNFCFKDVNNGCAKVNINIIDNPYLEGLYDLEILDLENGDHYVGQIKNGLFHGKGILTYKTGAKYQGEFVEGKRHGKGTITQLNGNSFEGNFVEDMRHGKGTLRWVNGSYIDTNWAEGNRVYLTGVATWTGGYKNSKMDGYGVYTQNNGSQYVGYFKDGVRHGYGIYRAFNGDYFEGEFRYNALNGKGKAFDSNGRLFQGEFRDNFLIKGTVIQTNGEILEGTFKNGEAHGDMIITYPDGIIYVGEYKEGVKDGYGKNIWPDGSSIEGLKINGKFNGKVIAISPDGHRIEGIWKDGELIAYGGLGIVIDTKGDYIEIVSTIDDTPAYKAGLKAGDIILQIGDQNVSQINPEERSGLMRGIPGTSIKLTIERPDIAPFVVELTREIITSLPNESTP